MADEETEARTVTPFRVINRGEDTLDEHEDVVFADFSPRVLPSEVPDEDIDGALNPKGVSAPERVSSPESTSTTEPTPTGTPAPAPADSGAGMISDLSGTAAGQTGTGTTSPTSSSDPKSGPAAPPA